MSDKPMSNVTDLVANTPEDELIDIELPIAPGIDWLFWLEVGLLVALFVLLAVLLLWVLSKLWQPLRLRMVLKAQRTQLTAENCQATLAKLFQIWQRVSQTMPIPEPEMANLQQKINQACFAKQEVSRETLSELLQETEALVQAYRPRLKPLLRQAGQQGFLVLKTAWKSVRSSNQPSNEQAK